MQRGRLLSLGAIALVSLAFGQNPTWRDNFDSYEYMIPARDGTKLYTVVYVPKGKTGPFPILMERTPYGAGNPNAAPRRSYAALNDAGYILAFQDVRGKGGSEGDFINVRPTLRAGSSGIDESTDTYDTVDYLIKNVPQNSGRVGLWGISYPGFYAGAGAIRNHPALKAVSPQAPVNDWFLGDDVHHNGVMFVQETFDFAVNFNRVRGTQPPQIDREGLSAYAFYLKTGALSNFETKHLQGRLPYWQELMSNGTYNEYWKSRALWRSFSDVNCAVLTVGGWYDKEDMWGALNLYKASERQNPNTPNYLIMGPWSHGQWASGNGASLSELPWGSRTGQYFQENVELPFFERYLRGNDSVRAIPEATMFDTGNLTWNTFSEWPPKSNATALYLDKNRELTWSRPATSGGTVYVADPSRPTPYLADYMESTRSPGDWLARDQRFSSRRGDTVTFQLPVQTSDLKVGGPVYVDFWVKTSGTDADLVVKVIDEFPENDSTPNASGTGTLAGYQHMVRSDIFRLKFRNSFERPEPVRPGQPTHVRFALNDVLHTFRKGHRILVQVSSYWFPIADRNPNQFMDIYRATDADFRKATIEVLHGGTTASHIELGVLPND
ncbi:MAG: CocE/NonD family hydrolase [Fimbriimonadaceae bacterium]|nr:CocE/NonD family hydrolase [Fimbriimonadaceae bacterium]